MNLAEKSRQFVASRAKMYAYRKIDKEVEEKRCKGTNKCVVSEGLTFDDYTTRPACLMVKRYIESKCCLRTRNTRCTRSTSIR